MKKRSHFLELDWSTSFFKPSLKGNPEKNG